MDGSASPFDRSLILAQRSRLERVVCVSHALDLGSVTLMGSVFSLFHVGALRCCPRWPCCSASSDRTTRSPRRKEAEEHTRAPGLSLLPLSQAPSQTATGKSSIAKATERHRRLQGARPFSFRSRGAFVPKETPRASGSKFRCPNQGIISSFLPCHPLSPTTRNRQAHTTQHTFMLRQAFMRSPMGSMNEQNNLMTTTPTKNPDQGFSISSIFLCGVQKIPEASRAHVFSDLIGCYAHPRFHQ